MNYKNILRDLLIYCWDNKKIEEFEFIFEKYIPKRLLNVIKIKNHHYKYPEKCLHHLWYELDNFKDILNINIKSEVEKRYEILHYGDDIIK